MPAMLIAIHVLVFAIALSASALGADPMDAYNVTWPIPSKDSSGSMPLGNGSIGLNVWVEESGDLVFYISSTDSWNDKGELLKLGRVRVRLSPNPFAPNAPFEQTLKLRQAEIEVKGGSPGSAATLRVWVDANQPVIHIEASSDQPTLLSGSLELWRTTAGKQADTVLSTKGNRIAWYHRNESSIWADTLKHQGMESFIKKSHDPLLHRTFGGIIRGKELVSDGDTTLRSSSASNYHALSVYVLTAQTDTPAQWTKQIEHLAASVEKHHLASARAEHRKWWSEFWDRSWIRVTPESQSVSSEMDVSRGYTLQRFISACAGRGGCPIKFNGSIFTVDSRETGELHDADYRRWGGGYWFQNTRLAYWPMLASGDFDSMRPFFEMIHNDMPFLKARTLAYFGHTGAFFPEVMHFWGAYVDDHYGLNRADKTISCVENTYIRWHFNGTLEMLAMMLDYYDYTGSKTFLKDDLLPYADEVLAFWDHHYKRDANGNLRMEPAQALETWQSVVNPTCDIAGLRWVTDRFLTLPIDPERRESWTRLRGEVPAIPIVDGVDGARLIAPAETVLQDASNIENPELYAVFPFRIYGVGKPYLEIARNTFALRRNKGGIGWQQDDTQAAFLGLTTEAQQYVTKRFETKHSGSRFPAFWGPNYDWIPDQDHGSNGVMALQTMLLQADGARILLFPAWPKEWDVDFKLHAPMNTIVEGLYKAGKLDRLKVTPSERAKDVVVVGPK